MIRGVKSTSCACCTDRNCTEESLSFVLRSLILPVGMCRRSSGVEHLHGKERVTGSNPVGGSTKELPAAKRGAIISCPERPRAKPRGSRRASSPGFRVRKTVVFRRRKGCHGEVPSVTEGRSRANPVRKLPAAKRRASIACPAYPERSRGGVEGHPAL